MTRQGSAAVNSQMVTSTVASSAPVVQSHVVTVAPFASRGSAKLTARLIATAPGQEAAALDCEGDRSVGVVAGEAR